MICLPAEFFYILPVSIVLTRSFTLTLQIILPMLIKHAQVRDVPDLVENLFRAKSSIEGMTGREVLVRDYKEYEVHGHRFAVGVAETTKPSEVLARSNELVRAIREEKQRARLQHLVLMVVDVVNLRSVGIASSEEDALLLQRAFGGDVLQAPEASAQGDDTEPGPFIVSAGKVVSRKKEFVPLLMKALQTR
jgi:inorganic pyrophosphatase/exopolyphosphatase